MTDSRVDTARRSDYTVFGIVVGICSVLIILQGVWAGIFIRPDKPNDATWVGVHDWGARAAIFLALVATVFAVIRLRRRRDLIIGSAVLFLLLFLEAYIGGEVYDKPALQAVHFPLALALLGLSVWLPMRARVLRRRN